MNTRRFLPVLLVPMLALAAVACGDDDDSDSGATTTAAGSQPTATGAQPTPADTAAPVATSGRTETTGSSATSGGGAGGAITVGSADFPESQLLAQIYGQALAANGFDVDYQMGIGSREVYYSAIESGEIDLVPEYTGNLLSYVLRLSDPNALPTATTVEEQVTALGAALPDGLEVLTPSTAEDADVIACTTDAAEKYNLTDLSSLGAASANITIGAPPEFETRSPFGLVGFKEIYGAEFKAFVPLTASAVADALAAGQIDCGNLFTTMSVTTTGGFVLLEDDKNTVTHQAVLPLVRSDVVTPELTSILDGINAQLTTDILKELMVKVEVDAAAPDVVAQEWLASVGD